MQGVLEAGLHRAGDGAGLAGADRVVVDLADGRQLGRGAGDEDLVGQVELGAGDVALDDLVAEVARDLDRPTRRLMPPRIEAVGGGVAITPSLDDEDVLARALADVAVRRRAGSPPRSRPCGLDLREHRVQVLARGLGQRDQRVGRDAPPRGDLGADAVLLALVAEVGAPLPDGDRDVDRALEREQAHRAVAAEGERADVAGAQPVAGDELVRGLRAAPPRLERDRHVVELRRLVQPLEVVGVAEDRRCRARVS